MQVQSAHATCCTQTVDARWQQLCSRNADVFEEPATPKSREIKHRIDLLNPDAPIKHHVQYRMSQSELDEVRK